MACRKAFDVDLVACLLDAARPEWSEFREHYPRCPECAAEVRTWTELQASLAPPHPGPEELIRFESRANDMEPEARKAVAAHIATCRSCRDELRALRAFDPRSVSTPAVAPKRRWWRPVRRLVLHPALAFAYGVAFVLAIPTLAPELGRRAARRLETARERVAPRAAEPLQRAAVQAESPDAVPPPALGAAAAPTNDASNVPAAPPAEPLAVAKFAATAPEGRMEAPASDDWPVVVLTPEREAIVQMPAHGLVLRLAPPRSQPALPAGLAWLRVRDEAGRRELREQQFGAPGSSTETRVPAAWLEPGRYRAAIVLGDDNRPLTVARFRVEP